MKVKSNSRRRVLLPPLAGAAVVGAVVVAPTVLSSSSPPQPCSWKTNDPKSAARVRDFNSCIALRKRARKRSELEPKRYTRPFAIESHRDSTFTVESSTKSCLHPYRNRCTAYNVYDSSLRSACWISSTLRKLRQMANINTLYPGSLRIHTNRLPSKPNRQPGERAAWFVWKGLGVTDPIPLIRKIRLEKAKASRHVFPSQTERRMLPPCKLSAHHPKRVAPAPGNLQGQNGLIRDPAHRDYSEQGCKLFEQIALACF